MAKSRLATIAVFAAVVAAVLIGGNLLAPREAQAQNPYVVAAPPIPYNYFVPPPGQPGSAAALYVCPRPTPPLVGHTFITYQPFAPHEFLYKHHRTYVRYNGDAGPTRTRVWWH